MVRTPMPSSIAKRPRAIARALGLLLTLSTCGEGQAPGSRPPAPTPRILRPAPTGEVATWQQRAVSSAPAARFLQTVAFDETRGLLVMFGGNACGATCDSVAPQQDLWEFSPSTGAWTLRTTTGPVPPARAGAAMVFDSARNRMLLFGGRSATSSNYEDLWEWDPTSGTWSERSGAGDHPSGRSQHAMMFEKSTGKILLFGGARSAPFNNGNDGLWAAASFDDTWQLDPATGAWSALSPSTHPSARHDFGLVWDSTRNKAVLFGGMQVQSSDASQRTVTLLQDTWEWEASTRTWSERTTTGSRPAARNGLAMAYDSGRAKVVLFGGGVLNVGPTNDMWDWAPTSGTWSQTRSGTEAGVASGRQYASMIFDPGRARLEIVAGMLMSATTYRSSGSNEVWEVDPSTLTFDNRSVAFPVPSARGYHAMAYNPATGKVYLCCGSDRGDPAGADLWEWDGSRWSEITTEEKPPGRMTPALAYDPVRRTLILYGGFGANGSPPNDTWEWSGETRGWTRLTTDSNPGPTKYTQDGQR